MGYTCSRPSLVVLTPEFGIEEAGGELRGGLSEESMSDVVEEQVKGETTVGRGSGSKGQIRSTVEGISL